ncbi:hypothetical protein AAC387_Pa09g1001 [Persea americana]
MSNSNHRLRRRPVQRCSDAPSQAMRSKSSDGDPRRTLFSGFCNHRPVHQNRGFTTQQLYRYIFSWGVVISVSSHMRLYQSVSDSNRDSAARFITCTGFHPDVGMISTINVEVVAMKALYVSS